MKRTVSLRLQVTLVCAALLAVCCLLLTLTNGLSAMRMADSIQALPVQPAQTVQEDGELPMMNLERSEPTFQARQTFHVQSILAAAAVVAVGVILIYLLVGRTLAPLEALTRQIRERTAEDLDKPLEISGSSGEVVELAQAFNQMSRRLDQVFIMQKNFSHNAAHEFRTPLAVLKTRIGLFRKKGDTGPQAVQEFVRTVEGEVDRLSAIVGSLLELTNLEQNGREEQVAADGLLREVTEEMTVQARARQISLLLVADPCEVTGNRALLRQAVSNLVENAVKYSPDGSEVQLIARREEDFVILEVTDQGPGIPRELLERVFEPFFRVDDARSRQQGGAGLGLALVRAIVEAHGGTVCVEENDGGGSRFVVKLPAARS